MKGAHDYGVPRFRVRRLPDERGRWRRHAVYEVEMTPPGSQQPAWTQVTSDPETLLLPSLGVGDATAVRKAADRAWYEETGAWESLYPGDRGARGPSTGWS